MLKHLFSGFLFLSLILHSPEAHSLAGLAERHQIFEFSEGAYLDWLNPADGCNEGYQCFRLQLKRDSYSNELSLLTFSQISVPQKSFSLVMAEINGRKGTWIVYDLNTNKLLLKDGSYQAALALWKSQGLADPSFITSKNVHAYLSETWESFFEPFMNHLIVILFIVYGPIVALITIGVMNYISGISRSSEWPVNRSRRRKQLGIIFLILLLITIINSDASPWRLLVVAGIVMTAAAILNLVGVEELTLKRFGRPILFLLLLFWIIKFGMIQCAALLLTIFIGWYLGLELRHAVVPEPSIGGC